MQFWTSNKCYNTLIEAHDIWESTAIRRILLWQKSHESALSLHGDPWVSHGPLPTHGCPMGGLQLPYYLECVLRADDSYGRVSHKAHTPKQK